MAVKVRDDWPREVLTWGILHSSRKVDLVACDVYPECNIVHQGGKSSIMRDLKE
jgi:hypothetical protein